jgi:signal transduction histidine kinase
MGDSDRRPPPVDATLKRIVVAYRVLSLGWLAALVGSTLATDPGADRGVVAATLAVATVMTIAVVVVSRDRARLVSWPMLAIDGAAAVFIGLSAGLADSIDLFHGGWLLSWILLVVYARPTLTMGLIAAATMSATQLLVPVLNPHRDFRAVHIAGDIAPFFVTAFVFGWGMETIRKSELKRMQAEEALNEERMLRARADDRAEIGGHLHDSVLQTLALIQQRAIDPAEVAHLARGQERELRRFINEMSSPHEHSFKAALCDAVAEVEDFQRVRIGVVVVGDREVDPDAEAMIRAAREALVNAAKHSGSAEIAVFAEVAGDRTTVFVRDRGKGFDPETTGDGRLGLQDSIVGRMERHGGTAVVRSAPGEGTEIELAIGGGST